MISICNKKLSLIKEKVLKITEEHKKKALKFSDLFHEYIQENSSDQEIEKFFSLSQ